VVPICISPPVAYPQAKSLVVLGHDYAGTIVESGAGLMAGRLALGSSIPASPAVDIDAAKT